MEQEQEVSALSQLTIESSGFLQGIKNGLNAYKYVMLTLSTCLFYLQ